MSSPSQPRPKWGTNTEKHINETPHTPNRNTNSSYVESDVRNRRKSDRNNVSRRNYHNAVGRLGSNDDDDQTTISRTTTFNQVRTTIGEDERRRLRRHLKRKSRIPGHVQFTKWMHTESKNHTVAVIGEFVGTTLFLFFAFGGTQVANIGAGQTADNSTTGAATGFNPATLLYISLSFGFSLMVNAWIFFRISGGLFNPAVTLALTLTRDIHPFRALLLLISQISGGCFAAYIVKVIFPSPFNIGTTLAAGTTLAQGVFIEALCTAELVFTIIMLAKEKHRATYIAPVGIGLSLFIGELVAVYYTGGSLNPARSFGPDAVAHQFSSDHWIYWVGPFIGTLLAVFFYYLMKVLEYEMANPGQDGDIENDPTQNPEHEIAQVVEQRQAEVEEIQAIEEEGGFDALTDISAEPSVLDAEGVVGMAVGGVRDGDEVQVQRKREGEQDLEAQWRPPVI